MKESILYYIWQHRLFPQHNLVTTDGVAIEIIDNGKPNTDAGPDFFNAKIKIGNTLWAGNIEIHSCSSDWKKHQHHTNKAYDNVILHVTEKYDSEVFRSDSERIPQIILPVPEEIANNYNQLMNNTRWVRCTGKIEGIPSIFIRSWKNALLIERLEKKTEAIGLLLEESNQHWEEAFYITLARSFGFGTNSQACELLAKSLPIAVLGKHKDQLLQIEALLFGQAGLLIEEPEDEYKTLLLKEYQFLKTKFSLTPIEGSLWKLLRLRPDNFPHIRLAQFAALIHSSSKLFSKIIDNPSVEHLHKLFNCEPSIYWKTHYRFSKESISRRKKMGEQSIHILLINTVVPFIFSYASRKGDETLKERALQILEELPSEKNAIIKNWQENGISSESAYDSQALIQLKKQYCDEKKCLHCRIGHKVLTIKNERNRVE